MGVGPEAKPEDMTPLVPGDTMAINRADGGNKRVISEKSYGVADRQGGAKGRWWRTQNTSPVGMYSVDEPTSRCPQLVDKCGWRSQGPSACRRER